MSDNKSFVGGQDRARVAGEEEYEVQAFAQRHGMTPQEVRDMIERIGNDRDALEREAAKLRRHSWSCSVWLTCAPGDCRAVRIRPS